MRLNPRIVAQAKEVSCLGTDIQLAEYLQVTPGELNEYISGNLPPSPLIVARLRILTAQPFDHIVLTD